MFSGSELQKFNIKIKKRKHSAVNVLSWAYLQRYHSQVYLMPWKVLCMLSVYKLVDNFPLKVTKGDTEDYKFNSSNHGSDSSLKVFF